MVNTYIPGFTPTLNAEYQGGPAQAALPSVGIQPSAPAIMDAAALQPSAPPIMQSPPSGGLNNPAIQAFMQSRGLGNPALQAFRNNALAAGNPQNPAAAQPAGLTFLTDRGRQAGYGKGSSGFVAFDPNAQYRMWDERGKNRIVSSGTGEAGLRSIYDLANQFNKDQGRKANYGIERLNPATGKWERILENDPRSKAGQIAKTVMFPITNKTVRDIALPVAASFIPGIGPVLGAALGSAASSAIAGRSLKDTLLRAGLSAGGAFAGGQLLGGVGAGGGNAVGGIGAGGVLGASTMANAALNKVLPGIIVQGSLGSAAGSAAGSALGAGIGGAGGALTGFGGGSPQPQQPTADQGGEIIVTGPRPPLPSGFDPGPLGAALPNLMGTPVQTQQPQQDGGRITLEDINKYLRAAGLASSLLGGGGGGRGGLGTIPAGFGSGFAPVFSGSLPRATLPGASSNFAQRPASTLRPQTTQDWYRYGYGPSQSFFGYVPEGEQNLSQAYTGYARGGMAEGGALSAVSGPGDGRSDEIPAMLSDGEYVIDAETVALLGDGSSKAGAERLDQFRINVRRDKGRKLAKGEFSGNAKHPEHYLMGGRA